jgi:hypothetical protein
MHALDLRMAAGCENRCVTGPPPPRQMNTYALLALLLSILVFPPIGIWLGRKAKEQIAVSGESGIELATVAEIYGWVVTGFLVIGGCLYCAIGATAVDSP